MSRSNDGLPAGIWFRSSSGRGNTSQRTRRNTSRRSNAPGNGLIFENLERREFLSAVVSSTVPLNLSGTSVVAAASVSPAAVMSTTTRVDTSADWTVYGQPLALTAFVSGGATGDVSFFDGTTLLGTAPLAANGQAKFWVVTLTPGTHSITAAYGGSATHAASASAPVQQSITPAKTTVEVSSSAGVIQNPILRPDRVVVVVLENGASNAIGDTANMPYLNRLASGGLVYNNSHGLNGSGQIFGQMNYLALYSGSTQGITDDFSGYTFDADNLAKSLADSGLSFSGYVESLPAAGDMTTFFAPDAPGSVHTDAYARRYNPIAQFTDVGAGKTNADVNKPFTSFPSDFTVLPTVSYVIPNRLHNTHGSNVASPYANDPTEHQRLRRDADAWLEQNIDGYLQWATANNSLLIVTTEDGDRSRNYAAGGTTIVAGDPRLFVSGVNGSYVTAYNVLRTIEDMYGLAPIGATATADRFDTDTQGRLSPAGPAANALVTGGSVTYTATISPLAPATGTPGGTVEFLLDGVPFSGPVSLVNGSASISVPGLTAGSHTITAVYHGSPGHDGNRAALTQPVNPSATSVGLASSAPSATVGAPISFTATVTTAPGSGVATGLVTFRNGATTLGSAVLDAAGRAVLTTSSLSAGTHSVTATYGGDANHDAASSAALTQVINAASAAVGLSSNSPSPKAGQSVTFTAKVTTTPGAPAPTGMVTFRNGTTVLGTVAVNAAGEAVLTTTGLPVGNHFISATYGGDAHTGAATSPTLTQVVSANASTTALATSAGSSTVGQEVVFTATVGAAASGGLKPGGTVAFFDGNTRIGTAAVDATGKASFATASLAAGTHAITAVYSGDANFAGSASSAVTQIVTTPVPTPTGPVNDKFADRIRLSGPLATATGTNVGATRESGEPKHGSNGGGKSVWWSWTAPSTGLVTVDTIGSSFKTVVGVYTGTMVVNLKKVSGVAATVSGTGGFGFLAKAGITYHIAVDGANGATGSVNLRVKAWSLKQTPAEWKPVWNDVDRGADRDDERRDGKKDKRKNKKDD